MEFNFNQQHNQVYHTPSSMYTYFSDDQAVKEGLWNERSMDRGVEILRGSMDSREEIQIELEKEMIREQILATEIVRLKEELRRGMTMDNGGGFPPAFRLNNRLEPRAQPVSFEEKYGGHRQEIEGFEVGYPNGSANWEPPRAAAGGGGGGSSEFNHWNENGSRFHGESQRWGLREGQWAWG